MKNLKDILQGVKYRPRSGVSGIKINKVICDSRDVEPGDLFVAMKGDCLDGHRFIKDALAKGALVILAEKPILDAKNALKLLTRDTRLAMPVIAANFYGHPSRKLKMIGVTGTNGKTTITYIIESMLKNVDKDSGVIGTINYRFKDLSIPAENTTPGPLRLQGLLNDMLREGGEYVVMEVSSHSLEQRRIDCIELDEAIFTNITPEHLDYHKTMKKYLTAKLKIFDHLKKKGRAILNNDDPLVRRSAKPLKKKVITYGLDIDADIMAKDIRLSLDGSRFTVITPIGSFRAKTKLIGRYNVSNILAAVATVFAEGIKLETIASAIEKLEPPPGRLEPITGGPFKVFVDFAHTDDALRQVLNLLKETAPNQRVTTVFGCGGDRDRLKRPRMGITACSLSSKVIVTLDNPRFEDPSRIMRDIENGIKGRFKNYNIIKDRAIAIKRAIEGASKGDIILIAGKGHEKCQIVKDKHISFDDCVMAKEAITNLHNRPGCGG